MESGIDPKRRIAYRAIVFFVAAATAVLLAVISNRSPRNEMEFRASDAMARIAPQPRHPDIVILGIDDQDIKQYGTVKKWPRRLLAEGLRRVESGKPKVVVMDLALDERTQTGDADLWRTVANNRNIVFGMGYNGNRSQRYTADDIRALRFMEKYALASGLRLSTQTEPFAWSLFEPPVSDLTGSARGVGVFVRETDPDGIVRNARLFYNSTVDYPQTAQPLPTSVPATRLADGAPVALQNLALITTSAAVDVDKDLLTVDSGNAVRIGGNLNPPINVPVDEQGRMIIRYSGPAGSIPRVSFHDVASGKIKPEFFAGKVVLIGAVAANDPATDAKATVYPGLMPRVEVTANAVSTLMTRSYVSRFYQKLPGILIAIGVIAGLLLMITGGGRLALIGLVVWLAYLAIAYVLFTHTHTLLPLVAGSIIILVPWIIGLILSLGPFRQRPYAVSETYLPPSPGHNDV